MPSYKNALEMDEPLLKRCEGDRQSLMRRETEAWLLERLRETLESARQWRLDYSSPEAFARSGDPYRQAWSRALGECTFSADFNPRFEPFFEDATALARWLYIDLGGGLQARAALALPKSTSLPFPLVIAQHGIGSSPENVFGLVPSPYYHAYGRALLEAGYAVLAPSLVTEGKPRARLQRLCLLQGRTIAGLEVGRIRRLLDFAAGLPELDAARVAMWGISMGGMYTFFTTPLEPRIKAAINCAFFNHRYRKMAVSSPLYSCFLDADEEHVWIPGWLSGGFGDAEMAALICPRPYQIHQGRADGIGWWPLQHEEFARAKAYYEKLGLADRIHYADHNGGHEILVDEGIAFLKRWL